MKQRLASQMTITPEIINDSGFRNDSHITKFTVGICASNRDSNLSLLLNLIGGEFVPEDFVLSRIILVASNCSPETLAEARQFSQMDGRLLIIQESERHGKAEALNKIFDLVEGDFLIYINGDALPSPGSIEKLLRSVTAAGSTGVVSARPFLQVKEGILSKLQQFMWAVHNESSLRLNDMNLSNHSSDEMMIVRSKLLRHMPVGVVNDGAYIAARAKTEGYSIKFCNDARVKIETPKRIGDSINQRRRILFGHFQVWKLVGRSPTTVESMMLFSPLLGLRITVQAIARSPRFLSILPIAIICELYAATIALIDVTRSTSRHRIWKRYGS